MSAALDQAAGDYIAIRRSFGYKLRGQDRLLADFCAWCQQAGLDTVTTDAALSWAALPGASDARRAERLGVVRGFARYLRARDPRCEVPPRDAIPAGRRRVPPYIYSRAEISALMAASRLMSPPLRAATFETVIGLLVVTGMRSGEVLRLERSDVDLEAGTVAVLATKFNKSRLLTVHPTAVDALAAYADLRDRRWPEPQTTGFFVCSNGRRLGGQSLHVGFRQLRHQAGLVPPAGSRQRNPRLHDLRHSFAVMSPLGVSTALAAQGEERAPLGVPGECPTPTRENPPKGERQPTGTTEMRHYQSGGIKPKDTYWYLSAVPELLAAASERVQRRRSQAR
jgi:integrase